MKKMNYKRLFNTILAVIYVNTNVRFIINEPYIKNKSIPTRFASHRLYSKCSEPSSNSCDSVLSCSGISSSYSPDLLAEAKIDLAGAIEKYSNLPYPSDQEGSWTTSEDFRQLANGVFQSEGTVSARFLGDGLSVYPVVSLGQTYTPESLAFFVRLYHEMGKVGALSIVVSMSGKLHII